MLENATVNRAYKDRLFRIIFQEKKELLTLYNALTGKNYDNPEELEVNTLEDAVYIHLKNDVSFILDDYMNLYEQQSTFNPNQPLRGLFYFSDLYKAEFFNRRIYSSRLVKIPTPRYIVFYNGDRNMPDRKELRLSDSFLQDEQPADIEVVAHMLNINYGHNEELLGKCRKLKEYAVFVDRVRKYMKQKGQYSKEQAVSKAIEECIQEGILTDILSKERVRVMASILSEFNEAEYEKVIRQDGFEDGFKDGFDDGYGAGHEAGHESGIQDGIRGIIYDYLNDVGTIPAELKDKIENTQDVKTLKKWARLAAKVTTLQEFAQKVQ